MKSHKHAYANKDLNLMQITITSDRTHFLLNQFIHLSCDYSFMSYQKVFQFDIIQ